MDFLLILELLKEAERARHASSLSAKIKIDIFHEAAEACRSLGKEEEDSIYLRKFQGGKADFVTPETSERLPGLPRDFRRTSGTPEGLSGLSRDSRRASGTSVRLSKGSRDSPGAVKRLPGDSRRTSGTPARLS